MYARLFCKTGPLAGAQFRIDQEATVGKSTENTISLEPSRISRNHARLYFDVSLGSYMIEDLKSRNGTFVDGVRVKEKQRLDKLNIITFANAYDFVFQVVEEEELEAAQRLQGEKQPSSRRVTQAESETQRAVEVTKGSSDTRMRTTFDDQPLAVPSFQAKDPILPDSRGKTVVGDDFVPPPVISPRDKTVKPAETGEQGRKTQLDDSGSPTPSFRSSGEQSEAAQDDGPFWLEVEISATDKRSFKLNEGENVIGRTSPSDIQIENGSISRKHAVITVKGGLATIRDLGSKNHTFIDNQRVNYEVELRTQVPLTFGIVKAILVRKVPAKG